MKKVSVVLSLLCAGSAVLVPVRAWSGTGAPVMAVARPAASASAARPVAEEAPSTGTLVLAGAVLAGFFVVRRTA